MAEIPGGGQLHLLRRGEDFSIRFGDEELMGSMVRHSEEALAVQACERLGEKSHVLIGGLGMGFTLRAALAALPDCATIIVAELVPKIVEWAKGPLAHLFGDCLTDPRLSIEVADVHDVIAREAGRFDAILLDVDNGPDGLIQPANDRIYCNWGLRDAHAALRSGGILGVWSAYADPAFAARIAAAGFDVEEISMDAHAGGDDLQHIIWLGKRRPLASKIGAVPSVLPYAAQGQKHGNPIL